MNKILSFKDYSEIYINPRRTKSETDISCKKYNNNYDYDYDNTVPNNNVVNPAKIDTLIGVGN
jgi:hypothetical protein